MSAPGKRCVLWNCNNDANTPNVPVHVFPKDKRVANAWHSFVGQKRKWPPPGEKPKAPVICGAHFKVIDLSE